MKDKDLKAKLSPIQYAVTQQSATERPFTGKYDQFDQPESMLMLLAGNRFFPHLINMTLAVDGLPLPNL